MQGRRRSSQGRTPLPRKYVLAGTEKKAFADKGDRVVTCDFLYSTDGKKFKKLGQPFRVREGKWIGAKMGTFCTRPHMVINDGGWVDVDWFRVTKIAILAHVRHGFLKKSES